jgi:phosphate transport system permease protein
MTLKDPGRPVRISEVNPPGRRILLDKAFVYICIAVTAISIAILAVLIAAIFVRGLPGLNYTFLTSPPGSDSSRAGIFPAILGSIWLCSLCALFTVPVAVGTAILLEEFQPRSKFWKFFHGVIQTNIANLAGVPSIVYGIIGLTVFASFFDVSGNISEPTFEIGVTDCHDQFLSEGGNALLVRVDSWTAVPTIVADGLIVKLGDKRFRANVIGPMDRAPTEPKLLALTLRTDAICGRIRNEAWYYLRFPFGRGLLAGALTLMLVVLPIVIISTQEAIRAVPNSLRDAAMGLGATPWQVVWNVTLPASVPGIMTGSILAMSRAIGEAAPILFIAPYVYVTSGPQHLMDNFSIMPLQIYNWLASAQSDFGDLAATGIIVLLVTLLLLNTIAVFLRHRFQRPLS